MQYGRINFVVDLQFGSTSKGLVASHLAKMYNVGIASTNNLANAGHTLVWQGRKFVSKILPVCAFHNNFKQPVRAYIGPGSGFYIAQLLKEIEECGIARSQVRIHPRAMIINQSHAEAEVSGSISTKHLASTMQGAGAVQAERMMRGKDIKLARDYPELADMICRDWANETREVLNYTYNTCKNNPTWLHEGSQGYSLGIMHGLEYPGCTSRECTVARELTDLGMPPNVVGDVYGVIRPYPIRVGNVVENGETVGYSGDWYSDQREITWKEIADYSGAPDDLAKGELTTVTKRIRRVATFSKIQLEQAIWANGVTHLALNFANYLDWNCYSKGGGQKAFCELPARVRDFVTMLEHNFPTTPVTLIGTGPDTDHMIDRRF